jgi:hypothetical protein
VFSPPITIVGVVVSATATCPAGKSVVGGGYELLGDYLALDVSAIVNRATSSTMWTVTATNRLLAVGSFGVQAFVICA